MKRYQIHNGDCHTAGQTHRGGFNPLGFAESYALMGHKTVGFGELGGNVEISSFGYFFVAMRNFFNWGNVGL